MNFSPATSLAFQRRIHSFVHAFIHKHLLFAYYVPGSMLDT